MKTDLREQAASPTRLLEQLSDRFAAFEAVAYSSIKLARFVGPEELSMDPRLAEAVLEFADDLRGATEAAERWKNERIRFGGSEGEADGMRSR